MRNKVNKLFDAITPFRLCFDSGLKTKEHKNGWYAIEDPRSNKNFIFLNDNEFINSNRCAEFSAGNVVDFLTYYKGITYEEAIQQLLDTYFDQLNTPILSSIQWSILGLADYLEKLNSLFKLVNKASVDLLGEDKFSRIRSYLSRYDTDRRHYSKILGAVSGELLNQELSSLSSCPHIKLGKTRLSDKTNYILLPFYSNRHLVSRLELIDVDTQKNTQITIIPHSHHFFGLSSLNPGDSCVHVFNSPSEVLNSLERHFNHSEKDQRGCVSLSLSPTHTYQAPKLPKALFVVNSDVGYMDIVNIQECFNKLGLVNKNQIFNTKFNQSISSHDYLLDKFVQLLGQHGEDSAVVCDFLRVVSSDELFISKIKNYLKTNNKLLSSSKIEAFFSRRETLNIRGHSIMSTNEGYIALDSVTSESVQFTNFSIRLSTTVMFRGSGDTFFKGHTYISGMEFPICISKRETQRQNDIVSAAVSSISATDDIENCDLKVPTLLDNTYGGMLKNILNNEINNCKIQMGVRTLGWDPSKDRYQGTSWYMSGTGQKEQSPFPHPGIKNLKYFDFRDNSIPDQNSYINNSVSNVIFGVVSAFLCRSYLGLPCPSISILNTPQNQELLKAVLHVFRQTRFLELNINQRSKINLFDGLDGYPVICICPNKQVARNIDYPAFILNNSGKDFQHSASEPILEKISQFSEFWFPFLAKEIIKHRGAFFKSNSDSPKFDDLLNEGLAVLRMLYPNVNWSTANLNFPIFNQWLSDLSPHELESCIQINTQINKATLYTRRQSFKRGDLLKELTSNGIQAASLGHAGKYKLHIVCDASPIIALVDNFYFGTQKLGKLDEELVLKFTPKDLTQLPNSSLKDVMS